MNLTFSLIEIIPTQEGIAKSKYIKTNEVFFTVLNFKNLPLSYHGIGEYCEEDFAQLSDSGVVPKLTPSDLLKNMLIPLVRVYIPLTSTKESTKDVFLLFPPLFFSPGPDFSLVKNKIVSHAVHSGNFHENQSMFILIRK